MYTSPLYGLRHLGRRSADLSVHSHMRVTPLVYRDGGRGIKATPAQVSRILQHRVDSKRPAGIIDRQREAYAILRREHIAARNCLG